MQWSLLLLELIVLHFRSSVLFVLAFVVSQFFVLVLPFSGCSGCSDVSCHRVANAVRVVVCLRFLFSGHCCCLN